MAILAADGFNSAELMQVKQALKEAGANAEVISKFGGAIESAEGEKMEVD